MMINMAGAQLPFGVNPRELGLIQTGLTPSSAFGGEITDRRNIRADVRGRGVLILKRGGQTGV